MIQPLRDAHRKVFAVLAIALPAVLWAGLRSREAQLPQIPATIAMPSSIYLVRQSDRLWGKHMIQSKFYGDSENGEDVAYSGTVSAAMEGALAGIPSIALSQSYAREGRGDTVPFAAAEAWAARVLAPLLEFPGQPGTLINVNFPARRPEEVKGIRVCRQGLRDYGRLRIIQRTDPRGYDYYWFGLGPTVETPGHSTDLEAMAG